MKTYILFASLLLSVSESALLAQSYNDMRHSSVAKYRLAVQREPNNAQAQEHLATALYESNYKQMGNVVYTDQALPAVQEEAIAHLEKAVTLQPNHYDWQSTLGMYLSNRGRYEESIPHLKQSLHLLGPVKPFNVRQGGPSDLMQVAQSAFGSHYLLGDTLVKLGRHKEAEAQYRQALQFDPKADWVLLGMGNALIGEGKRAQARAAWQKIVSLNPKPTYYRRKAQLMLTKYPPLP
jgi:tetratricopeptide (TPR) repeat protein